MTTPARSRVDEYVARVHELAPLVRKHADKSEREAQLAPEIVDAFHEAGLFRILLPAAMDGGDLTLSESLRIFEEVARLDGSAGWNLSICADGPLFGHFLARDAFEHVFSDPRAVSAGSLNPLGTQAVRVDGGWRFTGRATYVSGSAQASWLMAAGIVVEDGAPHLVDGFPTMRAGVFPMRHARILQTWEVAGMRGTGSNDCVFEDVRVPDAFTYAWPEPQSTWREGPLGAIPLPVQLGGPLAAVAIGVARHAIDELVEIAVAKIPAATRASLRERPLAQIQLGQAEGLLQAGRAYLYQATDDAWRRGAAGAPFDVQTRAAMRLASVTAAKLAAQAVDLVHDAAGMSAIQTAGSIQRCWRDVHTITQHVILSTARFEVVGRILFGLPPGTPII
jgi:alkylation response protein AidB-like acyl-CoA dehydrogenase